MNALWLDVTSLLAWSRPAVGVIRTECECARFALANLQKEVKFCRFAPQKGFIAVDRSEVASAISELDAISPKEAVVEEPITSEQAKRSLAAQVRSAISRLPRPIRKPLYNFLVARREALVAGRDALQHFRKASQLWFKPKRFVYDASAHAAVSSIEMEAPFSEGDVYISLGLDWDQKDQGFLASLKERLKLKCLLFCYDVIPVKFPHLCVGDVSARFARYFADIAWCADEILCISECSRRDLLALLSELGAPVPTTNVVTLGSDISANNIKTPPPEILQAAGDEFILYVSTIERRKNHETVYRALSRLAESGRTDLPNLVFVGMKGWGVNDFLADISLDPRVKKRIAIFSDVPDSELNWLYRNCLFTVFPSMYEGWGLAVAESLAHGKFCLASKAASIPEVGGDLIEYIDPLDVPRWAERINWYLDNRAALDAAEQLIKQNFNSQKWTNTAEFVFNSARAHACPQ